jgi:hypothetical protein
MIDINFGYVDEPDEELRFGSMINHNETDSTLSTSSNRLKFVGAAGTWTSSIIEMRAAVRDVDTFLFRGNVQIFGGGGASELGGIGLIFPDLCSAIMVSNYGADNTTKLEEWLFPPGSSMTINTMNSQAEYGDTALGDLRLQVEFSQKLNSKRNPIIAYECSVSLDGTTKTSGNLRQYGRGLPTDIFGVLITTHGASSYVIVNDVHVHPIVKSMSTGFMEAIR